LKHEGRLANNNYKDEQINSSLRSGNNSMPEFTDPGVMTIYLYAWHVEQHFKIKQNLDISYIYKE